VGQSVAAPRFSECFFLRKPPALGYRLPETHGRTIMKRYALLSSLLILAVGCDKAGRTDVEIRVNNGFLTPAGPIEVNPNIAVSKNEYRSWDGGFRGKQRLEISGNPTATLILVPSDRTHTVIVPDTIVYIGRQAGTTTAIEINRKSWRYRRVDLDNESSSMEEDAVVEQLKTVSWRHIGNYRFVAFRSLLWAWSSTSVTDAPQPPYCRSPNGAMDRLIFAPYGAYGTTGDADSPKPPPEWNVLIHALREFCPPYDPGEP
jgi:hypothetical protein